MVVKAASSWRTSPARYLIGGLIFVTVVGAVAVVIYMLLGWSFADALYMTVLTIYTVGYDEVRPIDTPVLRALTIGLIVLGCTGMIFVTSALVQLITYAQLQVLFGMKRMNKQLDALQDHTVICGFGRIGATLARELHAAQASFVVIEHGPERLEQARALGYLCVHGDATDEDALRAAGTDRARVLATVLPNDAANVFITLSARSINQRLTIVARGEAPSTERKLMQAGANEVVLPAHIGAEWIAEIILFPAASRALRGRGSMKAAEQELRRIGVGMEMTVAELGSPFAGLTIEMIERRADGAFLIVGIQRADGTLMLRPASGERVYPADGVMMLVRSGRGDALSGFAAGR